MPIYSTSNIQYSKNYIQCLTLVENFEKEVQVERCSFQLGLVKLYIFDVINSQYLKFGFTGQSNPWNRIQNGFLTNLHPKELCGRLGSENLNLVHVFKGYCNLEKCIQSLFPPELGEFWKK